MRVKTKTTIALGAVLAGALALSACSSGGNSSEGGGDAENSPVFLTRREARVAVIVAPIKEQFAARGSL